MPIIKCIVLVLLAVERILKKIYSQFFYFVSVANLYFYSLLFPVLFCEEMFCEDTLTQML